MKSLFAPKVAFRRLNRHVSEKKLNLFKLAASLMTEPGAGSTQIVWSDYADDAIFGRFANDGPDNLRGESATVNLSCFIYGAEESSIL